MPTPYLSLLAVQNPFPIGSDENNRALFSCNFIAQGLSTSAQFILDMATLIHNSSPSLGTLGTDLFIGPNVPIPPPPSSGPFITLLDTGGAGSIHTHNGDTLRTLSVQVITRASTYTLAQTRAAAIHAALDKRFNFTV